ncbi:MAG: DNA topoisomerase [Clostridia bacterium]|nr:DNA topoisomerase [Clostridia bacterium]
MAKNAKTAYNDQSITKLSGPDRVRKRPAVIFGSDGLEGCQHSYFEILANAVDEAREGFGNKIITTVYRDKSIEVEDFGRGVPLGYNEAEKCYNWELIYCELYAGGKYANNEDNAAYEYSLGTNGLGACATQYSSKYMQVKSYSQGQLSEISFKKGYVDSELTVTDIEDARQKNRTGTVVRWLPDLEVFTDINIPIEFFRENLRRQSVVNAGINFILRQEMPNGKFEESSYCYKNGLTDYIAEITKDNSLTSPVVWRLDTVGRDREDKKDYKLKAEIAFCVSGTVSTLEYYHNSSYLEYGGAPDKAVKTAFASSLDKYIKAQGKYNKNESKIGFSDIEDSIVVIINSSSTYTSYENQTKKAINNVFIYKALTKFLQERLEVYFAENPNDAQLFANQVLIAKRSREATEKERVDVKKKLAGTMDVTNRVEKFVSCHSKDPSKRELYIVEGDSAMSSCKTGRNAEFQAIIPVRGKTLNCMKSTYAKIFESKIICDLLRVIGCGVEMEGKVKGDLVKFDINNLRWSKIIICTDADEDGFQIRTLLLTLFYRLLPTLIRENRVFIAESPLFEITSGDETYFAYNESEKAEILSTLEGKKYTVQRSKGLGENDPDMMWKTTMNPATRRLIAVSPTDEAQTLWMFETLLGDDLPERKRFIAENAARYMKDADV